MFYLSLGLFFLIGMILGGKKFREKFLTLNFNVFLLLSFILLFIFFGILFIRGSSQIFILIFVTFIILFLLISHFRLSFSKKSKSNIQTLSESMTRKQALDILGLKEGADRETILKTHRDLMKKNHPDCGGSNYLTLLINEAKNFLLSD